MIKSSITSFIATAGSHAAQNSVVFGSMAVVAAVAVGFLFMFNEAAYQGGVQRRSQLGVMPETKFANKTSADTAVAPAMNFLAAADEQPAFAGELIAVAKDLAVRVLSGKAPVAELIAMLDMLERMGVKVKGLFNIGSAFYTPKFEAELDAKAA